MANIIAAKDLRAGHTIHFKNDIYLVLDNSFNKTAMREGIVKCKVKNLHTGAITVEVFTGMKLEQAEITKNKMNFLYSDNENAVFMNNETFEQTNVPLSRLKWEMNFLTEGQEVNIKYYGDEVLGISLPDQVTVDVKEAEEAVQGNTVQNVQKKAWLSTGWEISVPQFIKTGDKVVVDTITGNYVSRGK